MMKKFGFRTILVGLAVLAFFISSNAFAADGKSYTVQAGSFLDKDAAISFADKLKNKDFTPGIFWLLDKKNRKWYVVHLGIRQQYADARGIADHYKIRTNATAIIKGFDSALLEERKLALLGDDVARIDDVAPIDEEDLIIAQEVEKDTNQQPFIQVKEVNSSVETLTDIDENVYDMNVVIEAFKFSGNTVISTITLQRIAEPFKGELLSQDKLASLTDLIKKAYQDRSYIFSRAYVPEQDIENGRVKIVIVEGKIGSIDVTGNKYYSDKVIGRYFESVKEHGVLRADLIERASLLSKSIPKADIKTILKKGAKKGTTDVVLQTKDKVAVTLGFDYNNFGTELTSKNRYSARFGITEPLWGSTLSLMALTGDDWDDSSLGSAGLTVPVDKYGTNLSMYYLLSNYAVGHELKSLGLEGETKNFGAKISHPLLMKRNQKLNVSLGLDRKYTKNYYFSNVLRSEDELTLASVFLNGDFRDNLNGYNIIGLGAYQGFLSDEDNSTRENADKEFNRFTLGMARIQKISFLNLIFKGYGQYSGDNLVVSEMMGLGGYGTVRGHEPLIYFGDSGYTLSGELNIAPPVINTADWGLQFAGFYDHGGVFYNDTAAGANDDDFLSGYGIGLRLFYKNMVSVKFDVGWPVDELDGEDSVYYYIMVSLNLL